MTKITQLNESINKYKIKRKNHLFSRFVNLYYKYNKMLNNQLR